MIQKSFNTQAIYLLKKQLSDAIVNNNYDLQATEVLFLSTQLDHLMVPIFKKQFDSYYHKTPSHY